MSQRQILVTSALPYANGPIHLGHLVEYIQTDIWVRFQKMRGHRVIYVCADDTHGTAIMLSARRNGISEEQWIDTINRQHQQDFAGFDIQFDQYGSTHSAENRQLCAQIWQQALSKQLIASRDVQQLYDPEQKTFLADRFVKGKCPKCGAPDQAGDNCDKCGHTYSAIELVDPVSTISGAAPEIRSAPHFFFQLEKCREIVENWIARPGTLQSETANYLRGHFLSDTLRDWDLSRTAPYFGFEIPDQPGHYWYVWFDAPVGYIATTWQWCQAHGESLNDWWRNPNAEIHHFIGKDIVYFHTLFWPAILHTAEYELPTRVHVHGFLTVNGRKMSKRDGTFIRGRKYLEHLQPAYLRYYYATKLGDNQDDLDLNVPEFVEKVNSDLVNKVVNLVARCAKFGAQTGLAAQYPDDEGRFAYAAAQSDAIAAAYDAGELSRAMRLIMELADRANQFVDQAQPWKLAKSPDQTERLRDVVTITLNLYRQLAIYLAPVLPTLQQQSAELLGAELQDWRMAQVPLLNQTIGTYSHFMQRLDIKDVEKMIEETKHENASAAATSDSGAVAPTATVDSDAALLAEPLAAECTIEDFAKVDLRVARIVSAEEVPEARKLLKLVVSLGGDQTRQVFAGIKAAYEPADLVGRLVVIVANLKPRQMKFGLSEGMVCAAGGGGTEVFLLSPDSGAVPGHRIH
ncbi:MAG: methionine--tRNA ligase [Planctomycetaceae bacterium]|nr:methionine--tRNA ligase [Planctomycetaceae bacterium]